MMKLENTSENKMEEQKTLDEMCEYRTNTTDVRSVVVVFWDFDNTLPPKSVGLGKSVKRLMSFLTDEYITTDIVILCYLSVKEMSKEQKSQIPPNIRLIDVSKVKKDAADKLIIFDIMELSIHRPSCEFVLISGDTDFNNVIKSVSNRCSLLVIGKEMTENTLVEFLWYDIISYKSPKKANSTWQEKVGNGKLEKVASYGFSMDDFMGISKSMGLSRFKNLALLSEMLNDSGVANLRKTLSKKYLSEGEKVTSAAELSEMFATMVALSKNGRSIYKGTHTAARSIVNMTRNVNVRQATEFLNVGLTLGYTYKENNKIIFRGPIVLRYEDYCKLVVAYYHKRAGEMTFPGLFVTKVCFKSIESLYVDSILRCDISEIAGKQIVATNAPHNLHTVGVDKFTQRRNEARHAMDMEKFNPFGIGGIKVNEKSFSKRAFFQQEMDESVRKSLVEKTLMMMVPEHFCDSDDKCDWKSITPMLPEEGFILGCLNKPYDVLLNNVQKNTNLQNQVVENETGIDTPTEWQISRNISYHDFIERANIDNFDSKAALQNYAQVVYKSYPEYFSSASGSEHKRMYTSTISMSKICGSGVATKIKVAEKLAALDLSKKLLVSRLVALDKLTKYVSNWN